jgi:hypothetical protein
VSDLTNEELDGLEARYADNKPSHPCPYCGSVDWEIGAIGRGRTSWHCARVDLPDRETRSLHYSASTFEASNGSPDVLRAIAEIRRRRLSELP